MRKLERVELELEGKEEENRNLKNKIKIMEEDFSEMKMNNFELKRSLDKLKEAEESKLLERNIEHEK